MSRKPLLVAVDCDGCGEGVVLHGRGQEITVLWLEANLVKQGWTFADDKDWCPECTEKGPQEAKKKPKAKKKKGGKRAKKKASN